MQLFALSNQSQSILKGNCVFQSCTTRVIVDGLIARLFLSQTYKNQNSRPVECTFQFPVDSDCAVSGFAVSYPTISDAI